MSLKKISVWKVEITDKVNSPEFIKPPIVRDGGHSYTRLHNEYYHHKSEHKGSETIINDLWE